MVVAASGRGEDVVVTGLSGRLPESDSIEEFAGHLFAGVDLVTADDRRWTPGMYGLPEQCGKLKNLTHFDAGFFGVPDKLADVMDPQLRLLLEVTHETMVDAGLSPAELRGSRTGVYVGISRSESLHGWCSDNDKINGYAMTGCANSMLSNRVSYTFDLKGPSISIDVACSSSMCALAYALNDIRAGRCDAAIVAGINICLDPATSLNFHRLTMLSPDGRCAAFDESGRGYVRSEAVVAVLVQRRPDARRVYCTVRGASVNNDGYKPQGIIYPAGAMQYRIARETYEDAGLRPQDIDYVEAHGTGTKAGDPEEVNAIAELFCKGRETPLLLGSVKSNMGHPEPASGLCAVAKVVLAMESGVIPGNLHYKQANTGIPALSDGRVKVVDKNTAWQGGLVAVNSFGFGGTNAHVILEGGRGTRPPPAEYPMPRLVLASGRTDEAVERLLKLAADHPRDAELHALLDAVHARGIHGHPRRGYAVLNPARGSAPVIEVFESEGEPRPVWFVFSGMGSQWSGMARELLRLPVFAASIARSAAVLEPYGVDLLYVIAKAPDFNFDNVINCFVSITAVQVAMVDMLFELGVRPDGIIGHSLGEIACGYADGTLTAEQTVLCAYWRGRCTLDAAPAPGAMAAVGLGWEEAGRRCPPDIQLACHNSHDSVTISGPLASMEIFVEQLSKEGVFVKMVNTGGVAYHSKYIANVAPLLRARLEQLIPDPKPRSDRWLSSSVTQDQWGSDLGRDWWLTIVSTCLAILDVDEEAGRWSVDYTPKDLMEVLTQVCFLIGPIVTKSGFDDGILENRRDSSNDIPRGWGLAKFGVGRLSDAWYHVNNLLAPVRFANVLTHVPARALLVEVAPHALLQAVLKRALPHVTHAPLVRRDAPDALTHLLAAIGKAYAAGAQPQVSRLYPVVEWPVSRGTPGLASHISWDHSTEWAVADFKTAGRTGENIIECDLGKPDDAFIAGHNIEGRVIYPGTGYLMLVWRTVAKMNNLNMEQAAVVFENVKFHRATIVSHDAPIRFLVSLLGGTGEFEVREGGDVVVTGTARLAADAAAERLPADTLSEVEEKQDDLPPLSSEEVYKELSLRGYNYKGVFRGMMSSNAQGTNGLLRWDGNWIAFMDTVLQLALIGTDSRDLYLPTRIQRIVIDPKAQPEAAAAALAAGVIPVKRYRSIDVIVSGGVEFRGVISVQAPRRANIHAPPKLEKYVFMPYDGTCLGTENNEQSKMHALTAATQLLIENCGVLQLKLAELALERPVEALLMPYVMKALQGEPQVQASVTVAAGACASQYSTVMDPLGIKVSNKNMADGGVETDCHMVLGADVLARPDILTALAASASFVLLEEPARKPGRTQQMAFAAGLTLVSRTCFDACEYVLLRRAATVPAARVVLEVRDDDYAWVELLKDAMKRAESEDMRVYVWSRAPDSGVQGLATCLRREPGGDRLRLYYLPGASAFDPNAPAYRAQVRRDLAFNVLCDGVWGTFRHLPLIENHPSLVKVEHAYVNALTRGDLSSLRWIESDLRLAVPTLQRPETNLYHVYYSSLNFRDIMLTTGKLALITSKGAVVKEGNYIGMEFSGRSSTGKRVMGIVTRGLATTIMADVDFLWEVPEQWSLEEAATVPMAYATAYYALVVRGRMRRGEAVLVHAGAGGVGQAAIAVALHAGCTVFATVGTPEKRAFLRERFPQLSDANIGNSRDCSFEQLVLHRTRGRGVDLVLNSLAGYHLQASLRCLAVGGRFLEIGKVDLSANTALGMGIFMNNTTVHGVLLDVLFGAHTDHPEKAEVVRCVAEGIAAGAVRPLPATVYGYNQIEQAFRYMASGKHIGKVLIRVREETDGELAPVRLAAMPRTYMHPDKSYVLIGGLGGFGLELGEWLVGRGARALIINSSSGVRTGYQARCIRRWRTLGVRVLVSAADAATAAGARELLHEAAAAAPVGGIFNLAAVLRDAIFENQTPDTFRTVAKPKIDVTRSLDLASRELAPELEYFVAFSSLSCGRGNPGQSNYGFANSGMERLCERRRADGLPALAVQWGAVGDVGLFAAMRDGDRGVGGIVPQRIASCLQTLETLLASPHAVVSSMLLADKRAQDNCVQAVANVLGIRDIKKVSETATLVELGMDSLMGAEIKQTLERSYDVLLGVQEIRALTFGKLRSMAGDASRPAAPVHANGMSAASVNNDLLKSTFPKELIPNQVLIKLPSQPPTNNNEKLIFMVHPIEGSVELLRDVASHVRGAVYGLQCARAAPLDDMPALARFYVQHVRAAQPQPPYALLGYSFGASVAFEMALQLEQDGCATRLILVDGSPAFIETHTAVAMQKRATLHLDDADLLAYLANVCCELDPTEVANELERLSDGEARLSRVAEMVGAGVEKDTVRDAAHSMCRKLLIGYHYRPAARLHAPVTLFTARDNFVTLKEDYGLAALCAGEVRTRQLAATHHSILAGDAARTIADHVSELLAQH